MIYSKKIFFACYAILITVSNSFAQDLCQINLSRTIVINVREQGAIGDGFSDDTKALQNAIDKASVSGGKVFIPSGIYLVDAITSVMVKSNVLLELSQNAIIKAKPNNSSNYSILRIKNASNIVIIGGILLGDRYEHQGTTGEWGMGLSFDGASNVVIKNVISRNNWGDGFYIGGNSKNINFCTVLADNNRRQGMSIVHGSNILVSNSSFINTKGTPPECGIDIEPNNNQTVTNVEIKNSNFIDNYGAGIASYLPPNPLNSRISEIKILNNYIAGNKKTGISIYNTSFAHIHNNKIYNNKGNAIFLDKKTTASVIRENTIKNNIFLNDYTINDQGVNSVSNNYYQQLLFK